MNTGPVLLEGSIDQPLVAAMGVTYKQGGKSVSYSQLMGLPAEQATTEYYFPRYTYNASQNSQLRVANLDDTTGTTVEVYVKGILRGSPISLGPGEAKVVPAIKNLDAGPIKVVSTDPVNIATSLRVIYKNGTKNISYSELMGYPKEELTTAYLFPWYVNSTTLKSQLRVANLGAQATDIQVYINGVLKKTLSDLAAGKSATISVTGKGTMRVVSTNPPVNILASMRQIYLRNGITQSFSELMGFPEDQVTTSYAFPWYTQSSTMSTKLRIVNMDSVDTTVEVYIGQDLKGSHFLEAGQGKTFSYPGVNNGPVRIETNPDADILASMQITFKQSGVPVSYSESMAYPYLPAQPTIEFWLPWYTNNKTIKSQLFFGYP